MRISIRADHVEISGYVNAVERPSKILHDRSGDFIETVREGAFKKALARNDNVRVLLNHDHNRDLGGTKDGNLELEEDNIGLRARAKIYDKEVIDKARKGDLTGWSFGFTDRDVDKMYDDKGIERPFISCSRGLGSQLFYDHSDEIRNGLPLKIGSRLIPVICDFVK